MKHRFPSRAVALAGILIGICLWSARHDSAPGHASAETGRTIPVTPPPAITPIAEISTQQPAATPPAVTAPSNPATDSLPPEERDSFHAALRDARLTAWPLDAAQSSLPCNKGISHFAGNPAQQINARFLTDGGVAFASGLSGKTWSGTLRMERTDSPVSGWEADATRVTGTRGAGIVEWYQNREQGFEHGFTLHHRGADDGVTVRMKLDGLRVERDPLKPADLMFIDPATDVAVLSYTDQNVWDATGRVLPAEMHPVEGGFELAVNDTGAQYPLTIDPIVASLEQHVNAGVAVHGLKKVVISGDTIAASYFDVLPATPGSDAIRSQVLVFVKSGTTWILQAKLVGAFNLEEWIGLGQQWNGDWSLSTFGDALALEGDTLVVGEPAVYECGAAYIYQRAGGQWTHEMTHYGDDDTDLGASVAIRGNRMVAGCPAGNFAAVYEKENGAWNEKVRLRADESSGASGLGTSVALDGALVFAGAPMSAPAGAGAVFYFQKTGNVWMDGLQIQPAGGAAGDGFGTAIAISGGTLAVGAPGRNFSSVSQDIGGIYLFSSAPGWPQTHYLERDNRTANDRLGLQIDFEGDVLISRTVSLPVSFLRTGGTWSGGVDVMLASGVAFAYSGGRLAQVPGNLQSAVVTYLRSGNSWVLEGRAVHGDGMRDDNFGLSMDLDGDTAVAGALNDDLPSLSNAGSAYVLRRAGTAWAVEAKLLNADPVAEDRFGVAVAISGDTIVVGADADDTGPGTNNGSISIFVRNGTTWSQQGPKLAPETANNSAAGRSVAIDGNTVVTGAIRGNANTGRVWSYVRSGTTWTAQTPVISLFTQTGALFGYSVALQGNRLLVGEPLRDRTVSSAAYTDSGMASAYARTGPGAQWDFEKSLTPAGIPQTGARFGFSVAVDGNRAIIGAPGNPPNWATGANHANNRGSAFWATHDASGWSAFNALPGGPVTDAAYFGFAVEVKGNVALVSAIGMNGGKGAVLIYRWESTEWVLQGLLPVGTQVADDFLGTSIAMSGDTVVAGGYGIDSPGGLNSGGGIVFRLTDPDAVGPVITLTVTGGNAVLSWIPKPGWTLWRNAGLSGPWTSVIVTDDGNYSYPVNSSPRMFFRLQRL